MPANKCTVKQIPKFAYYGILILFLSATSWAQSPICSQIFSYPTSNFAPDRSTAIMSEDLQTRVDNLINMQIQIEAKNFSNEEQFRQALHFFEKEMNGLNQIVPNFKVIYKNRYVAKGLLLKQNHQNTKKVQKNDAHKKNEIIRSTQILEPQIQATWTGRHSKLVSDLKFSHNDRFFVSTSWDGTAKIYDTATKNEIFKVKHSDWIYQASFSPDDRYLLTSSVDKSVKVFDVNTGKSLFTIKHQQSINHAEFNNAGNLIVTASSDGTARISQVAIVSSYFKKSFSAVKLFQVEHKAPVTIAKFSPNDRLLATGSTDGVVKVLDTSTDNVIFEIQHKKSIGNVEFSHNGLFLLTSSEDGAINISDVSTGQSVLELTIKDGISWAIFSHSDHLLAVASNNGIARVFDLHSEKPLYEIDHTVGNVKGRVYHLAFSQDDHLLVTATENRSIRFTEVQNGSEILEMNFTSSVNRVTFRHDNNTLATGLFDGSVSLLKLFQKLD